MYKLFLLAQRYSFESNSQPFNSAGDTLSVVSACAKILIWKQFTTGFATGEYGMELFLLAQRYSFESNSQQIGWYGVYSICCFCLRKDTHLKAIHNQYNRWLYTDIVVSACAKILIWKQFTTAFLAGFFIPGCFCLRKDTHLKAIHNFLVNSKNLSCVVSACAKILIWKQFTTKKKSRIIK